MLVVGEHSGIPQAPVGNLQEPSRSQEGAWQVESIHERPGCSNARRGRGLRCTGRVDRRPGLLRRPRRPGGIFAMHPSTQQPAIKRETRTRCRMGPRLTTWGRRWALSRQRAECTLHRRQQQAARVASLELRRTQAGFRGMAERQADLISSTSRSSVADLPGTAAGAHRASRAQQRRRRGSRRCGRARGASAARPARRRSPSEALAWGPNSPGALRCVARRWRAPAPGDWYVRIEVAARAGHPARCRPVPRGRPLRWGPVAGAGEASGAPRRPEHRGSCPSAANRRGGAAPVQSLQRRRPAKACQRQRRRAHQGGCSGPHSNPERASGGPPGSSYRPAGRPFGIAALEGAIGAKLEDVPDARQEPHQPAAQPLARQHGNSRGRTLRGEQRLQLGRQRLEVVPAHGRSFLQRWNSRCKSARARRRRE